MSKFNRAGCIERIREYIPEFEVDAELWSDDCFQCVSEFMDNEFLLTKLTTLNDVKRVMVLVFLKKRCHLFTPRYKTRAEFNEAYASFQIPPALQGLAFEFANAVAMTTESLEIEKPYKGFYMDVVPRYVWGWRERCVTGSGQTLRVDVLVDVFKNETGYIVHNRLPSKFGTTRAKRFTIRKPASDFVVLPLKRPYRKEKKAVVPKRKTVIQKVKAELANVKRNPVKAQDRHPLYIKRDMISRAQNFYRGKFVHEDNSYRGFIKRNGSLRINVIEPEYTETLEENEFDWFSPMEFCLHSEIPLPLNIISWDKIEDEMSAVYEF
jgi:hypothetical protein